MSRTRSVLITVCFWSVSLCSRIDLHIEKVWSLGVTVQLHCNNSARYLTAPNGTEAVCWMLPDFTVLYSDQGRFQVLNNKCTLKIVNVTSDDLGLYHCTLRTSSSDDGWLVLHLGLNVRGPYFDDLWDKYRPHTTSGFTASFSFLLVAVGIYLIRRYRYSSGDEDLNDPPGASTSGELHGKDGTSSTIVGEDVVYENWKNSTQSPHRGSTFSRYVADVYPGTINLQCTTRL